MTAIVAPAMVQYGDQITINGHVWQVKEITGPDQCGAYDLYLTDGVADRHEVITEEITLIY
jgi:hypothetical protein